MEYFGFKFYQKFPESLVECVESEVHSDTFKKNYARTSLINKSVSECLIKLNGQTCVLSGNIYYNEYGEEDSSFCEKGLDNGLKSLLDPFLTTISQITETHGLQTSVAVFLQNMPQDWKEDETCLLYTSPSPRDATLSRMPSSA